MIAGIHFDVPAETYHADPAPFPSLSCSIAQMLLDGTPRRAWASHARCAGRIRPEATAEMDEGTVLHTMLLGSGTPFEPLPFDDWRTNAAKAARAAARALGHIPIKQSRADELAEIAHAVRKVIARNPEIAAVLSEEARSEVTLLWEETGPLWFRARADILLPDPRAPIFDFKFTSRVDDVWSWDRRMVDQGYDLRAAFYRRGAYELRGYAPPYVYVVVETTPPYDVMALQATPAMLALGEDKLEVATSIWLECLHSDNWPGHPPRIFHVSPPGYAAVRWEERKSLAAFEAPSPARPPAAMIEQAEHDAIDAVLDGRR